MADTERKFSELSVAGTLTDNDILALSQTDIGTSTLISVRATLIAIATHIAKVAAFTNDLDTTSKTLIGAINELKQLISLIPQFSIDVVQVLPVSDISETTIYLVPSSDPEQGNYYEEYIYVNNTWELVGTTAVDLSAYYTKLEVDVLLAAKANTSDVTAALALKEAKADMDDDVTDIVVGLTDTQTTAPGNPVTLTTDQSGGAKSAVVTFTPKQSGSGDPSPSNIRPISGWDSLVLNQSGKNMSSVNLVQNVGWAETNTDLVDIFNSLPAGNYVLSFGVKVNSVTRSVNTWSYGMAGGTNDVEYKFRKTILSTPTVNYTDSTNFTLSITTENVGKFTHLYLYGCGNHDIGKAGESDITNIQISTSAGAFEPYQGETHTATFPDTVYGGIWKATEGKAVITHAVVDLGSLTWSMTSTSGCFRTHGLDSLAELGTTGQTDAISTIYANNPTIRDVESLPDYSFCVGGSQSSYKLFLKDTRYTSASDFESAISGQKICYKLATPTEITLTPEDIELLKGLNTVWSDANGTVTVGYAKLPNGNLGAVVDYIKKLEARISALES